MGPKSLHIIKCFHTGYFIIRGIKKPSTAQLGSKSLTKQEIAEICKKEPVDDDEIPDEKKEIHRMQGLGYHK